MESLPTIKDIAIELGVSISTVSRALRNQPDVNPNTREAVLKLAKELDYQPNRTALNLLKKKSSIIGVMVPNFDYFFASAIRGIDEGALESGYTIIVCQSNESYGKEIINAKRLLECQVEGFIVSVSSGSERFDHFEKIIDRRIPMVFFDRDVNGLKAPKILLDNFEGGYLATKHLIDQGYKKISFLGGPEKMSISNKRLEGYKFALKEAGFRIYSSFIEHGDFSRDFAYINTMELLKASKKPDAIFAMSDRLAIGAYMAIKKRGMKIPDDVGLIGFNNEPVTELLTPSISTIDQPAFEMGKKAVHAFLEMVNDPIVTSSAKVLLKPRLIVRESSIRKTNNTALTKNDTVAEIEIIERN